MYLSQGVPPSYLFPGRIDLEEVVDTARPVAAGEVALGITAFHGGVGGGSDSGEAARY